ncbi:NUDIX hydrolase [Fructobacillus ficulneus]|nr:NUDIX domain-containing protein [Fructobacillus ficulneus]
MTQINQREYHLALGVYGIYAPQPGMVLVIKKNQGPYANRFDLPGGTMANYEGLSETLIREFTEETGTHVEEFHQIGAATFRYPWQYEQFDYNKHIAVFNLVERATGAVRSRVDQFTGQDSNGAVVVNLSALTWENSSPLVMKAKEYLETGTFRATDDCFEEWKVL